MKRRTFFKNLTAAVVGVVVAPAVVKATKNILKPKREGYMNVNWNEVTSPLKTVTTVGDSTGGESAKAWIIIDISNKHHDCPRVGYNLYYKDGGGTIHPLMITEVALRSGYNSSARLILKPFSPDLIIGKGAIKNGTIMCVGDSYFGNVADKTDALTQLKRDYKGSIWKLDAAQKHPYNSKPFDISDFDRVIPLNKTIT